MKNAFRTILLATTAAPFIFSGCHNAGSRQAASPSHPVSLVPAMSVAGVKEIHVDQNCRIRTNIPEGTTSLMFRTDSAICHLESVYNSSHVEEVTENNEPRHQIVYISEQEYLLRDVLLEPVTFIVEQRVPKGWRVDSDPQPAAMKGEIALFRVMAQPGQIVRLHVGEEGTILSAASVGGILQ